MNSNERFSVYYQRILNQINSEIQRENEENNSSFEFEEEIIFNDEVSDF